VPWSIHIAGGRRTGRFGLENFVGARFTDGSGNWMGNPQAVGPVSTQVGLQRRTRHWLAAGRPPQSSGATGRARRLRQRSLGAPSGDCSASAAPFKLPLNTLASAHAAGRLSGRRADAGDARGDQGLQRAAADVGAPAQPAALQRQRQHADVHRAGARPPAADAPAPMRTELHNRLRAEPLSLALALVFPWFILRACALQATHL